jgi:membrane fusion protein (multidrug efflux system)
VTVLKLPPIGLAFLICLACAEEAPPPPAPVDVVVAEVVQKDVPITVEWIGTTEGAIDAEIRAQVSGYLVSRDYVEGTEVKEGQLLFQIDPRSYRAALDQARGDLGRAKAALTKSRQDVARYTPLAAEGAVSQQELDNAIQATLANEASVEGAQAAVEKAELDLSFTSVRSPIAGIAGVARGQLGNLVGPGDPEPLTRVSQLDPIRVSFPLSEQQYLSVARQIRAGRGREKGLELILADGSVWPHRGTAVAAASGVDPSTGTLLVRGEFPNPDQVLRTGQYARVRAVAEVRQGALVVPQRAVSELQGVFQVAVVGPDNKIAMRVVQPGPRHESVQVIEQGLQAGERVVAEGIQKVRDGTLVNPRAAGEPAPAVAPAAAPAPHAGG